MKIKRRIFLAASILGGSMIGSQAEAVTPAGAAQGGKQILDLRTYTFTSLEKRKAFEAFLETAMIPALNRQTVQPVGAFVVNKSDNPQAKFDGETSLEVYVLLPHVSLDSVATLDAKLASDTAYTKALAALNEGPKDAAYARYESSLLLAFDHCPKVEVPSKAATRVLQLRIYEAFNNERNRAKVRMFNEGGEIKIFREAGINPVFFGHAFTGDKLPNLTYMVGFENDDAMKAAWAKFGQHPGWVKLKDDLQYKDTVSNITNIVMRPVAGSQV